jgi:TPR repeat protein
VIVSSTAHQGNDLAQKRLGFLYERVNSVPKDYLQVYMWYKLEEASGGASGAIMRDGFAARMTSDQLSEAKKLVREWKPKN